MFGSDLRIKNIWSKAYTNNMLSFACSDYAQIVPETGLVGKLHIEGTRFIYKRPILEYDGYFNTII